MKEYLEKMKQEKAYVTDYNLMPYHLKARAKNLLREYDEICDQDSHRKNNILEKLFGSYNSQVIISNGFKCDYGFNIHFKGFAFINYNVVMLDTSPIHIGSGAFIGPGVCLACSGHSYIKEEREKGIGISAPIFLDDDVWLGANVTICPGVKIGKGSVIGAGSVVTKDIPEKVIAAGNPCKVIREIKEDDKLVK